MFDAATDTPAAPDPADARVEARMALLREMAEIGLHQARRLDRQSELAAIYSDTCAVPEHLHPPYARRLDEIARAFAQLSRAVSLAVALEDRIDADHRAGPAAAAERALKRQLLALRVATAKADAAVDPAPTTADPIAAEPQTSTRPATPDLRVRLDRLLNADLAELDTWLSRPPEDVIAHIRRELGLEDEEPPATPRSPPSGGSRPASAGRGGPPGAATVPPRDPCGAPRAAAATPVCFTGPPARLSGGRSDHRPIKKPPRPDRKDRHPCDRAKVSPI